jgi:N-acetylglucosaminyldiphosphoundecaprenol N-acetyl-beta-D-mannosaminyltransferase
MLFVAMGSPRQEQWIVRHQDDIRASLCMGIGGTLDVISGKAGWAPPIFRRTGTEFLYRLVREPRRWRRQLCLPLFLWSVLCHAFLRTPAGKDSIAMERVPARPVAPTGSERRRAA